MLKIVIDTNVLISSLLNIGNPKLIIDIWLADGFHLVTSTKLIEELSFSLKKPRLKKRLSALEIEEFLAVVKETAVIVTPIPTINACRDPKDNKILDCAIQAKANAIVTGDQDLLILNPFDGIDIITPTALIKRFIKK